MRTNHDDHIVVAGEIVLRKPKRLAQQALDAVAANGDADAPTKDEAQSRSARIIRPGVDDKRSDSARALRIEHGAKGTLVRQTGAATEAVAAGAIGHGSVSLERLLVGAHQSIARDHTDRMLIGVIKHRETVHIVPRKLVQHGVERFIGIDDRQVRSLQFVDK